VRVNLITEREARALRQDAASTGNVARGHLPRGTGRKFTGPHRVRVRVGPAPVHGRMARDDLRRRLDNRATYLKQPPYCRACGSRIGHGEKAIEFQIWGSGWEPRRAFIHETCP
jgi:hypothetical protein